MNGLYSSNHGFYEPAHHRESGWMNKGIKGRNIQPHSSLVPCNTTPQLALYGQPYPTLPFSMGGYGLEENINQLRACRRIGKTTHQRQAFKPRTQQPSSSYDRKRPTSQSSSVYKERRGLPRLRLQTPSHPITRVVPKPLPSHEQQWMYGYNAVMWHQNMESDFRFRIPESTFPVQICSSWEQQPQSHRFHEWQRNLTDFRVQAVGAQYPSRVYHGNEKPWLIKQNNQMQASANMARSKGYADSVSGVCREI